MSQKYEKLKSLLKELFQLDQPDLDFGLYRIMHAKSAEVTQFLERNLLPQVKQEFGQYKTADKAELEQQLAKAIEQAQSLGADPETLPKVKDLREKLKTGAVDIAALEGEVYDHLINFFSRYYSEGDFLSKRRYSRDGRYAIPYDGEEVKLYWANHDQYYIKTSEYLRDYAFRLKPDNDAKPMRVHFCLADAAEGEHGNIKPPNGKDRVFVLAINNFSAVDQDELIVRFEFRPTTLTDWPEEVRQGKTKPPTQRDLIDIAERRLLAAVDAALSQWIAELAKPHVTVDGEKADYTRLRAHLNRYVARNTFDYFIHKDLGGFLCRELDFYIKNEVMHLDDVENETVPRVEQYLSKIKVIRRIAGKIIAFLAQLEDFEKALWLKKKFVVETQYCVAIKEIPKEFHEEIAANKGQLAEWKDLYGLEPASGKAKSNTGLFVEDTGLIALSQRFQVPPSLMIDTRHYPADFTARLLEALGDLEAKTDGILIHSENFQALSLMQARYREKVKCVYIDPPYNTGQDGFAYKDNLKSSSWACMIGDRLALASHVLSPLGVLFSSINEIERATLDWQLRRVFGDTNRVEELIWVRDTVSNNAPAYSTNHEYIEAFARNKANVEADRRMFRETRSGFEEVMSVVEELAGRFPSVEQIHDAICALYAEHKRRHIGEEIDKGVSREEAEKSDPWKGLYPYKWAEYRDENGVFLDPSKARERNAHIWVFREVEPSMPSGKQASSINDPESENYRFYRPLNPLTSKRCKAPKRGWAFPEKSIGDRPSFEGYRDDNRLVFKESESAIPQLKYFLHEVESVVSTSVIRQYADGEPQLEALFGMKGLIDNPKPPALIGRLARQTVFASESISDFFAGSGTTGHALINLNRDDGGRRTFILIEMADYFDTVLMPRLKKVSFAPEWKEGKPKRLCTPEETERGPRLFKIVRLESYEDTLNNLEVRRSATQQSLLDTAEAQGADKFREQYLLRYMLKVETRESPSLLNVAAFTDPTLYRLVVKRPGSDESHDLSVDLIETFNWLLGLTVQHVAVPHVFSAQFERDSEKRLKLKGRIKTENTGHYWFRTINGTMPDGRKALIIWRKLTGNPEEDNLVLDEWFTKQGYSSKDSEFGLIYVNGGNNLENLKTPDDTWKVRLIEDDFQRLMFATEGQ